MTVSNRDVDVTVRGTSTYTTCDSTDAQLVDPHEEYLWYHHPRPPMGVKDHSLARMAIPSW